MLKRLSIYITFVLTLSNCMAFAIAQTKDRAIKTPLEIVRELYDPFVNYPESPPIGLPAPDSFSLIEPIAAPHLKWLTLRNDACEVQTQGICRIDFDPVVAAQDFDLSGKYPNLQEQKMRSGRMVTAQFTFPNNGGETTVYYDFIFDHKRWLIDDVRGKAPELGYYDLVKILSEKF